MTNGGYMRLKFWNVHRRINKGAWVYLDRFYWRVRADECVDGQKKLDKTNNVEYKIEYS